MILVLTLIVLTGCGKNKKYDNFIKYNKDSASKMALIKEDLKITDKEILVYERAVSTEFSGESATVTTVTSQFSSTSYQMASETKTEFYESMGKAEALKFDLSRANAKEYEISKESLTVKIENSKIDKVFGGSLETSDDITVTLTYSEKLLKTIEFSYTLTSGRFASLKVEITY